MIVRENILDERGSWRSEAYHVAARYRTLTLTGIASGIEARWLEIEPGGRLLPHAPSHGALYICLEGRGRAGLGERDEAVAPGDCLAIPARTPRALHNDGEGTLRLLVVTAPEPRARAAALLARWLERG